MTTFDKRLFEALAVRFPDREFGSLLVASGDRYVMVKGEEGWSVLRTRLTSKVKDLELAHHHHSNLEDEVIRQVVASVANDLNC